MTSLLARFNPTGSWPKDSSPDSDVLADGGRRHGVAYLRTGARASASALIKQLNRLRDRASSLDITIVEVVLGQRENGGRQSLRPSIQMLLDVIGQHPTVSHVIVDSDTRLSRDPQAVRAFEQKLEKMGVKIIYASEAPGED